MIRENNKLIDLDENLLTKSLNDCITNHIKINSEDDIGCFISAQSTSEEMLMFQRYLRNLGIKNLDHRTNEVDFNYQDNFPIMPHLGCQINELSKYDNIILFGVNIKDEYPILSIKLNEAVNSGTKIYSYHFSPIEELFSMEKLVCQSPTEIISELYNGLKNIKETKKTLLLIGPSINYLSNQTSFHSAVNFYSNKINADTGYLTDFCNSTSGWLLGNVPHRLLGGEKLSNSSRGLDTDQMIKNKLGMLIFYNLEPEYDFANSSKVISALQKSQVNIFFTSYITPIIEKYADFIIPISTFAETDGSFINIEGKFQSYNKIVNPTNKVQEGWKFLNELCILNDLEPYDISQVRHKIREVVSKIIKKSSVANGRNKNKDSTHKINKYMLRHIYSTDQIVRRSSPLHLTKQSKNKKIFVSSDIVQSTEDTKSITVDEKGKKYRINNFEINKDLPAGSIIYTSCFNNKFVEGKSSDIKIDK